MDLIKVAKDNYIFFIVALGTELHDYFMKQAVLRSFSENGKALYGINYGEQSGYLSIDTTSVIKQCSHGDLIEKVWNGILHKVASKIYQEKIKGDLNDEVEVIEGGYKFSFKIIEYERDREHNFKMNDDPGSLPENEQLGIFVELKITVI